MNPFERDNESDDETTLLVEETGVIYSGEEAARPRRRKPRTCDRVAIGVAVASLLGFAAVRLAPSTKPATNYAAQTTRQTLQWRTTNDYVEKLGVIGADYAWTSSDVQIIDAWRPFQLYLDGHTSGTVVWTLTAADGSTITKYGNGVSHEIQEVGDFVVKGTAMDAQGYVEGYSEGKLLVRYVRREIRDLTQEDRNRYLDALVKM